MAADPILGLGYTVVWRIFAGGLELMSNCANKLTSFFLETFIVPSAPPCVSNSYKSTHCIVLNVAINEQTKS